MKMVQQVVNMLEFIEIGRSMHNEVFCEIFRKQPMLIYH